MSQIWHFFFHYELVLYMFVVAAVQQFDPKEESKK